MEGTTEVRRSVSRRPVSRRSVSRRSRPRPLSNVVCAFAAMVLLLLLFATPAQANLPGFPDVPASHPYYDAITDLAGRSIIGGYTNGNFGPDDPVTRQQFAKMIVLTAGYPVAESDICPFTDVEISGPGSLYPDNYVAVAAAHGITVGTAPGLFSPEQHISRYQVLTMVVRTADALQPGMLPAPAPSFVGTAGWGDSPTHSPNARRAEYNGLTAGLPLSNLDPWGDMSRGEVAQVLHNLLGMRFEDLGGSPLSAPAVVSRTANRLDVFTIGQDHGLWHSAWNGSEWSGWEPHGGSPLASDPVAVSWGINRLDVFARGQDDAIWHISRSGSSWSAWTRLDGAFVGNPSAVSWGVNRLDVFARGLDSHLYHKYWDGVTWSGWEDLGGPLASDPVAVSWGPGRIDVFMRAQDSAIWHKALNGAVWSGWESLGGPYASAPGAVSWGAGRLDVFALGLDGRLYSTFWDDSAGSSWWGWQDLGGALASDPVAVSWGVGRIDVFARSQDNQLWHRAWNGVGWYAAERLNGPIATRPSVVSWGVDRLDVFVLGIGGTVLHRWYDGTWHP